MNSENGLLHLVEHTQSFLLGAGWSESGEDFFEALARFLAECLNADYVCIDKLLEDREAQTVAVFHDGHFEDNVRYKLDDTPCGMVKGTEVCLFTNRVRHLFPKDIVLQEMKAESYAGITLWATDGRPLGLIAVISREPIEDPDMARLVLRQVSIRAASELEHRHYEEQLREREFFFKESQQAANIGSYKANILTGEWESSPEMDRILGIGPDFDKTIKGWSELIHPDDQQSVMVYLDEVIQSHSPIFDKEYRIIRRSDGFERWVHGTGKVDFDRENGRVTSMTGTIQDITDRKHSEQLLRYHANLVETISEAIISTDSGFKITSWNKAAEKIYGWSGHEVLGKPISEILQTEFAPGDSRELSFQQLTQQGAWSGEVVQKRKDGASLHIASSVSMIRFNGGPVTGLVAINSDITKRKSAEEKLHQYYAELESLVRERTAALSKSEEKYRTVADYTYDWETWTGPDGKYLYISPSCEKITGYKVQDFLDDDELLVKITHPDDREMVSKHQKETLSAHVPPCSIDFRITTLQGELRWVAHNCQSVFDSNGQWFGRRGSNRDITKRKKSERVLIDSQESLRALTWRINEIAEEERAHIAREIHDELGHLLTALKFDLENIMAKPGLASDVITDLNETLELINTMIEAVQKISTELRPGILDHLGLFPAMEWQIKQFQKRTRICCKFVPPASEVNFSRNEITGIFRILQEMLTNIARHSKATHVVVIVKSEKDVFQLTVSDNGKGFDMKKAEDKKSLGLLGMKERALSIGGEIWIDSILEKGTTIVFAKKMNLVDSLLNLSSS